MAQVYPFDRDVFLRALRVQSMRIHLPDRDELSGMGDGTILRDQLGPRLWAGEVQVHRGGFAQIRQSEALIGAVNRAGGSFLVYDVANRYPAYDDGGRLLGSSVPTINTIAADTTALSLAGLPNGYTLTFGDRLGFQYGSNPTRYALHEVSEALVSADASGVTPEFQVSPAIWPGAQLGAAVDLVDPCCKAIVVPGSFKSGTSARSKTGGPSFQFIQTMR